MDPSNGKLLLRGGGDQKHRRSGYSFQSSVSYEILRLTFEPSSVERVVLRTF